MFLWVISLPITQILQFSWRVLSLLSFVIPFTIGLVFNHISRTFARVLLFVIAFFSIIYLTPTFEPEKYSFFYEYHAEDTGVCATTTWEDEYLPKTVADCASNPRPFIEAGDTLLKIDTESPNFISGRSESVEPVRIQINKYLFPGWTALVDGKSTRLEPSEIVSGTASFIVPSGTHEFEVKYSKTKLMMLADITSLSSLIIISFLLTQVILKSLKRK